MAKQRIVNTAFWDDGYVITLNPLQKLLFLYLLTNPLTNILGVYQITSRRIAFDLAMNDSTIAGIIKKFENDGRVSYVDNYMIVHNFVKHQSLNPNIVKGIERELELLPEAVKKHIDFESLSYLTKLNLTKLNNKHFEECWNLYPRKLGKKEALRHYLASVKNEQDEKEIMTAINNYKIMTADTEEQFIKHGATFFNNWRDYVEHKQPVKSKISGL